MSSLHPVRGDAASIYRLLVEWDAAEHADPLVVETSGSTGTPKQVVLSRAAMRASADATHRRLGGPGQWVLALPPTFVAGLQVLFRSVRAGTAPVLLSGRALTDACTELGNQRRYLSLVPTQLHRMLAHPGEIEALCTFDTVLLGGAALDDRLRAAAESEGVRVVATYGMAETCGGCVYDGRPLDHVRVATGPAGRLRIAGPVLFDGYRDAPVASAEVLRDGWFWTNDVGTVVDGVVHVEGRADDVVITGGVNVPAGVVAARLRAHPGVLAAEVVGVEDDEWGQALVAVARTEIPFEALREWVAQAHPRAFAPRRLVRVEAIPLLNNGKVDRLAVERLARG